MGLLQGADKDGHPKQTKVIFFTSYHTKKHKKRTVGVHFKRLSVQFLLSHTSLSEILQSFELNTVILFLRRQGGIKKIYGTEAE